MPFLNGIQRFSLVAQKTEELRALVVNAELDSLAKVLERQSPIDEAAELKRLEELEKNKHADMLSKKYGKEDAEKILKGLYWIGMTKQMAEYSRGRPDKINTTVTANTTREQWIYRKFNLYLPEFLAGTPAIGFRC